MVRAGEDSGLYDLPLDTPFERMPNGLWRVAIPCPPDGIFRYKLVVDGDRWIEDPNALLKEEDPIGGFRSVVLLGADCRM